MTIRLGIAPINWSNDDDPALGGEISFEQCINEMAETGYVGTELGNKYPRDTKVLSAALEQRGLTLSSAWFSTYFTDPAQYQTTLLRFMDHLSFMRALGARYINVCECAYAIQSTNQPVLGLAKPVFSAAQWELLIQGLHAAGRIAHDFGMQIVYHYHAGTGVFSLTEIDYLMAHTSPTLVSLLLDTGHAAFADIDSLQLIHNHGQRIRYVHLKDIRADVLQQVKNKEMHFMDAVRAGVFTVPGDGTIDFRPIFAALAERNYSGWMIVEAEQDPAKAKPSTYAKMAFDYVSIIV